MKPKKSKIKELTLFCCFTCIFDVYAMWKRPTSNHRPEYLICTGNWWVLFIEVVVCIIVCKLTTDSNTKHNPYRDMKKLTSVTGYIFQRQKH